MQRFFLSAVRVLLSPGACVSKRTCKTSRRACDDFSLATKITVWSIEFEREFIRNLIINKMMPEDLDRAIAEAERKKWRISCDDFIEMIFVSVLLGDAIVDVQFRQTYLKGAC